MHVATVPLLLASVLPQAQPASSAPSARAIWRSIASKVPARLTGVLPAPGAPTAAPPMEILVGPPARQSEVSDPTLPSAGEPAPGSAPQAAAPPALPGRQRLSGQPLDVYSRMQAKTIAEWLVSPGGAPLKFESVVPTSLVSPRGAPTRDESSGVVVLLDPAGARWALRYRVVGPPPSGKWSEEPGLPEEAQVLARAVAAGDWTAALDPKVRAAALKSAPNQPFLIALSLLAALEKPEGREAQIANDAARLAALAPRNPEALILCAASYVAIGQPDPAGRLRAWAAAQGSAAK